MWLFPDLGRWDLISLGGLERSWRVSPHLSEALSDTPETQGQVPVLYISTFTLCTLPSMSWRELLSVAPFHPPPPPPSPLAFRRLILFLPLPRKQFEAKDAWLRATMAQSALICCSALWAVKTCGQEWDGMGGVKKGGRWGGKELSRDLGKGCGGGRKSWAKWHPSERVCVEIH